MLGRTRVSTSEGMIINPPLRAQAAQEFDVVIVPAIASMSGSDLDERLASPCGKATVRALKSLDTERIKVASACTGVFTVAAAGLLDGRTATTSWFLANAFRERFPSTTLDTDSMVVSDGPFLTGGAAFAHIDLTLAIVRRLSPELANTVAQTMLAEQRMSQGAFVTYDRLNHDDTLVKSFERHIRANLHSPLDVASICAELGTSRRTLERRTQSAVNSSPLAIIRQLRVEKANHLRRTTDLSIEAVAAEVGYANAETLRALLRTQTT